MDYSKIKYMHVERIGTDSVESLLIGKVYVFPKIDGTNGVIWYDKETQEVRAGSRNRELTLESDNAGFMAWVKSKSIFNEYFKHYPNRILYGEWLVPHSLKDYRDECWRNFYVFDVGVMGDNGRTEYLPYDVYREELAVFNIEWLPPLLIAVNPTEETIRNCAERNTYLMKTGAVGEGVVCKNYDYYNRYGHQIWGKCVRNEFKEKHAKVMGCPSVETSTVEEKIVEEYVTQAVVDKEYDKIRVAEGGWKSSFIPRLLNMVYYVLVTEESWNFVKKFKNPKVDYKRLQAATYAKVKALRTDVF